jgi:hypothetical protein
MDYKASHVVNMCERTKLFPSRLARKSFTESGCCKRHSHEAAAPKYFYIIYLAHF